MKLDAPKNINYCATVVQIKELRPLAKCDNVQAAIILGSQVIVGKNVGIGGHGIFFPPECALSHEYLSANNLYRKPEWGNEDPTQKGYFEEHGRVKTVTFRGHRSEGLFMPLDSLSYIDGIDFRPLEIGVTFDSINGQEICHKYVSARNKVSDARQFKATRRTRPEDAVVEGQFKFHIDTPNLRRIENAVSPSDMISITDKWHGTSAIFSNVLQLKPLTWLQKACKFLGVDVQETQYGGLWASRRVVKGVDGVSRSSTNHYYGSDVWASVGASVLPRLPQGYTVYGEIVGYAAEAPIQKDYTYGHAPHQNSFHVYRVTVTNAAGNAIELSWPQLKQFCSRVGLETVREIYYGTAWKFASEGMPAEYCNESFEEMWDKRVNELVDNRKCLFNPGLPAEGIVVRIDDLYSFKAFKLKSFEFLKRESEELDKGTPDMEESGEPENA